MASELSPVPDDLGFEPTIRGLETQQRVFDRYLLKRILGRGGMGIVWLAHDERLDREVALKFLPDAINFDPAALDDLKRETRRCLDLTHPGILRIYDFVQDERAAAISMEYVNGDTLAALRIARPSRVFEVSDIRNWMIKACQALHYAHEEVGVVHRDLKPANFMVTSRGQMKVADFGIAQSVCDSMSRLTMHRSSSGTLAYMSPQQLNGEMAKPSDDIYALGATIYEMLAGKPPFHSGDVSFQIRLGVPRPVAEKRQELEVSGEPIPPAWEEAIASCLAKVPEERPASMADLAERLRQASPTRRLPSLPARPITPVPDNAVQTQKRAVAPTINQPSLLQKNWKVLGGIGSMLLIAAAISVWPWHHGHVVSASSRPQNVPAPITETETTIAPAPVLPAKVVTITAPAPVLTTPAPAQPVPAQIQAACDTPGAIFQLDGQPEQPSPASFKSLSPGTYQFSVSAEGFETKQQTVVVAAGAKVDLGSFSLARLSGNLNLNTLPDHAHYVLTGTEGVHDVHHEGTTPEHFDALPAGTYQLTLSKDGFPGYSGAVAVHDHATKTFTANLTELSLAANASANTAKAIRGEIDVNALNAQEKTELAGLENQAFSVYLNGRMLACANGELQNLKALGVDISQQQTALATRQLSAETEVATQLRKLIHEKKWASASRLFSTIAGSIDGDSLSRLNAEFQQPIAQYQQQIATAVAQAKSAAPEVGYLQIKTLVAQYPTEVKLQLALADIAERAAPDHARLADLLQTFHTFAKLNKDDACLPPFTTAQSIITAESQQLDAVAGALTSAKEGTPEQKKQLAELQARKEVYESRRIGSPDKNNPFSATVNFFGKAVTGHKVVNNRPYFESRSEKRDAIAEVEQDIETLKSQMIQPQDVIDQAQKNYDAFAARVPWGA